MESYQTKTRFDLEQDIMDCWTVVNDIDLFYHNSENLSEDDQMNFLLGLKTIYQVRFEKLFSTFEQLVHDRKID